MGSREKLKLRRSLGMAVSTIMPPQGIGDCDEGRRARNSSGASITVPRLRGPRLRVEMLGPLVTGATTMAEHT